MHVLEEPKRAVSFPDMVREVVEYCFGARTVDAGIRHVASLHPHTGYPHEEIRAAVLEHIRKDECTGA